MAWLTCHHKTAQLNNSMKTALSSSQVQHRHPHVLLMTAGVQHRAWTSRQAAQHNNIMTALCSGKQLMLSASNQVRGQEYVCNLINCLSSAAGARMPISQTGHNHDVHLFVLQTHPAHRQQQQQMLPGGSSSLHNACKHHQTLYWQQLQKDAEPKTQQPASAAGILSPSSASRQLQPDSAAGLLLQVRIVCIDRGGGGGGRGAEQPLSPRFATRTHTHTHHFQPSSNANQPTCCICTVACRCTCTPA